MVNKVTNIKERILAISDHYGISKEEFFAALGLSYGNFKGRAKDTPIASDSLANILTNYPQINPEWLLHGIGRMLKTSLSSDLSDLSNESSIPLIPIEAMAGFGKGDVQVSEYEVERFIVPEFKNLADFMVRISGTSMIPKYYNGDIVACKKVPIDTFLQWGKAYIMDTEQGPICKRVFPSKNEGKIVCRSEKSDMYPDFELPYSAIRSVAIILGVIRVE